MTNEEKLDALTRWNRTVDAHPPKAKVQVAIGPCVLWAILDCSIYPGISPEVYPFWHHTPESLELQERLKDGHDDQDCRRRS